MRSFRRVLVLGVALATVVAPVAGRAAVLCQRGRAVKLRTTPCKKKEQTVADLGTSLAGIWQQQSGNGLANGSLVPTFLTLNADGTGVLNRRDPATHLLSCTALRYARGGGVPTMTLHLIGSNPAVVLAATDGKTLTVTDDAGTSVFGHAAAVDPGAECGTLVEASRLTNLPVPFGGGGLAFNGASFIYLDSTFTPVIVNASNGTIGTPPTLSPLGRVPMAAEGSDTWGKCLCGADDSAVRSSLTGTAVDTVNTGTDLGGQASIVSLAVPAPGQLLLLVRNGSSSTFAGRLLLVNTTAEPDTLVSQIDFNVSLQSFGVDGGRIWGLFGVGTTATVVRADPTTGLATATFRIPDTTTSWRALTAVGGKIFILGSTPDGKGVVATFNEPTG
jgi:hypothetical protein